MHGISKIPRQELQVGEDSTCSGECEGERIHTIQTQLVLSEQGIPQVCVTGACRKVIMKGVDGERSITRGCANKSEHGLWCTKYILSFSSLDPFKYLERKGEHHKLIITKFKISMLCIYYSWTMVFSATPTATYADNIFNPPLVLQVKK